MPQTPDPKVEQALPPTVPAPGTLGDVTAGGDVEARGTRGRPLRELAASAAAGVLTNLERLAGGLLTAIAAVVVLALLGIVLLTSLIGIGLPALPGTLRLVQALADRERQRLSRWGATLPSLNQPGRPATVAAAVTDLRRDPGLRRDVTWLGCHATLGLLTGMLAVVLPLLAVRDGSFPLWWRLVPPDAAGSSLGTPVHDWWGAAAVGLLGVAWAALTVGLVPALAWLQAWPGSTLLAPQSQADLQHRIAQLTATRAAALQSHTTELRRIERALHDGAQNRLIAVNIQLGTARRLLTTSPGDADAALERAQQAAEDALTELRALVRDILPPALDSHDLAGALAALAAGSSVRCAVDVGELGPLPAATEAAAYYVVAEALTNVTRHSGATRATVRVRQEGDLLHLHVHDDGHGGADEAAGTGLAGMRRRVEAHDGTLTVTSPPGGPTDLHAELPCAS